MNAEMQCNRRQGHLLSRPLLPSAQSNLLLAPRSPPLHTPAFIHARLMHLSIHPSMELATHLLSPPPHSFSLPSTPPPSVLYSSSLSNPASLPLPSLLSPPSPRPIPFPSAPHPAQCVACQCLECAAEGGVALEAHHHRGVQRQGEAQRRQRRSQAGQGVEGGGGGGGGGRRLSGAEGELLSGRGLRGL